MKPTRIPAERLEKLTQYRALCAKVGPASASNQIRMARTTLDRWGRLFDAGGLAGLVPRKSTGRPRNR